MSRIWGYITAGAGLFTAGILFVCAVFSAGKRAERAKRDVASLKRREENQKTFRKVEVEYESISATDVANRLNNLR